MFDRVGSGAKLVRATCVGQEGDAILVLLAEWKKSVGGARRCWFDLLFFGLQIKLSVNAQPGLLLLTRPRDP